MYKLGPIFVDTKKGKDIYMINYLDYDNSILSLINSIEKHYGVETNHNTLKTADELLKHNYRNIVIMVFDAMGSRNLQELLPETSFLRRHMLEEIHSVFPPTTTAATTTLASGLAPSEHSWLGWTLHFSEVNDNVNIFINTNNDGQLVADYHVANHCIPYITVVDKIREQKIKAESISKFGTYRIASFEELLYSVKNLCEESGPHYLYTYWNEPDFSMHEKGVTSDEVITWMKLIDSEVELLCNQLQDTILFIIADHGHINGRNEYIGNYPDIIDTLRWLPTIEPRSLAFHVKEGKEKDFCFAFRKHFAKDFMLLSKQEVITSSLFGKGNLHPRFEEFIGDYLAIAIGNVAIFNSQEETDLFVGVHAGMTEKEMMVPLIVVERK
ncbi:MAG: type phosphodiesterase / nucleotide pyrophosphatase [Herbinix sp.]|jgi:predicted AlkP superfamily pyrophosphatase or phosphodiesterase|nr:type phosphodiesterase / nucleotide pyrophosphatase [Herbinix sp.]